MPRLDTSYLRSLSLILAASTGLALSGCGATDAPLQVCIVGPCQISNTYVAGKGCVAVNKPDGITCDDKNSCTTDTVCTAGACNGQTLPDGTACDDDNVCTQTDLCTSGQCIGSNFLVCSDADPCHQGTCDTTKGCIQTQRSACSGNALITPLTGCTGSDYAVPVTFGSSQSFAMLVDSGSTTTAVASSSCSSCNSRSPEWSSDATTTSTGQSASSVYVDNSGWEGSIYRDLLQIGSGSNFTGPQVSVRFAAITSQSSFFSDLGCYYTSQAANTYQGILGLGPSGAAVAGTDAFIDEVKAIDGTDAWAIQVCPMGGHLWMGGYDPNYITTPPTFTPATTAYYYSIGVEDVAIGSSALSLTAAQQGNWVVDTGTSVFILYNDLYTQIANALKANSAFSAEFPASFLPSATDSASGKASAMMSNTKKTIAELDVALPSLVLTLPNATRTGTFSLTLLPSESYLLAYPNTQGSTTYYYFPGIYASGDDTRKDNILGNNVMANRLVVFDRGNAQIGFAPAKYCAPK